MSFKEVGKVDKNIKERWEAIDQGLVPKDYKKTKVGIIPEDWDVKKLGEVADVISGGTPSTSIPEYWADEVLWATPGDVTSTGKYIYDTARKISNLGLEKSSARLLPENSVLMTSRATIGESSINKLPMATNQGFKSFICHGINYEYLYYNMEDLKKVFKRKASGSTFLEISKKDVDNTKLQIPHLEEQERIADILSTWDRAIESYGKLLEEKKERTKGLMQLLLTGEKRLGGFSGSWKEVRLGDIADRITTKNNKKTENILTISASEGLINQEEYFKKQIASKNLDNYIYLERNDFAYNKSYSKGYPFGVIRRLNRYKDGVVSSLYICFRIKDGAYEDYIEKYFNANLFNHAIYKIAEEGARNHGLLNVGISDFFNIKITLPGLEEQKAIAEVLSSADREIELLEKLIEGPEEPYNFYHI